MRKITAAGIKWLMGAPAGEYGQTDASAETQHFVMLTNDYYIGVFEFTKGQSNNAFGTADTDATNPMAKVSWNALRGTTYSWPRDLHAVDPSSKIGGLRALTGLEMDLPTEAEWEYACRAGTSTSLNSGKNIANKGGTDGNMDEVGWYYRNCDEGAHHRPVGLKAANAFGLHDMHGNVGELCLDRAASGADYQATFATGWEDGAVSEDPEGAGSGTLHTARGGCYFFEASLSRSAVRYHKLEAAKQHKMVGFRLVCPVGSDWK